MLFHHSKLPAVDASKIPTPMTVPQETVGVGNVIMALLCVSDDVPMVARAVHPDAEVTATLA